MTEEEIYNDHEQDAERFANFVKAVLRVIGAIAGILAVNYFLN